MKAYVVLQKGFEYNDEIYSAYESGHGYPTRIFFTKEAAEDHMSELNIKEFKDTNITQYSYEIKDVVNDVESLEKLIENLNQKYGKIESKERWDRPDQYRLHPNATLEESKEYIKLMDLSFFEIVETDVDKQDLRESKIQQVLQ
jgi:hypothetical protein